MKALAFGELLFDLIENKSYLGGAPLNFAAHLAKLGAESYLLSAVGNDELGKRALKEAASFGVNTSLIQQKDNCPTGTVPVELVDGHPSYTIRRNVAYDFIGFDQAVEGLQGLSFDLLYYGSLAQRNKQSANTLRSLQEKGRFRHVFYDINLRPNCFNPEIIRYSLQHCTIFKLNDKEVLTVSHLLFHKEMPLPVFAEQIFRSYQPKLIIITAGEKGCYVYDGKKLHFVEGYPAKVADTVGAGDAFSAAFSYFYWKTTDPLQAAKKANRLGAFVASQTGAVPEYDEEIINQLEIKN